MYQGSRRVITMVTDNGAPGLMLYGLHRKLNSDTDDSDYEPGKISKEKRVKGKRKKGMNSFPVTSEEESSSESSDGSDFATKGHQNRRRSQTITSDESTAISSSDESDVPNDFPVKKKKRRLMGAVCSGDDSEDSDYVPKGKSKKIFSNTQKKKLKQVKKSPNKAKARIKGKNCTTKRNSSAVKMKRDNASSDKDTGENAGSSKAAVLHNISTGKARKKLKLMPGSIPSNDSWSTLPVEILSYIFNMVGSSYNKGVLYVCRCARVCRHWYYTASKPVSWKVVDLAFLAENMKAKKADRTLKRVSKGDVLSESRELIISGWTGLTDKGLRCIAQKCPRLESLNISNCQKGHVSKLTAASLLLLAENCSLKKINFSSVRVALNYGKTMMQFFEICGKGLTHINMSANVAFSSAVFNSICNSSPNLQVIDVSSTSLRAISFKDFQQKCPLIQELYFTNLRLEPKDKATGIEICTGFPHLRICSLATLSDSWLSREILFCLLKSAEDLSVLDIRGWQNISLDERIPSAKLERLFLSQCSIDIETVSFLCEKWSSCLWEIDLSKTHPVQCDFMEILQYMYNGPYPCFNLRHLNLSGTAVSDSEVKEILKHFSKLEFLDLTSCRAIQRGLKRDHSGQNVINELRKKLKSG